MADVAFLLLVFFMVATTLQRDKAISMKLPAAYDGPAKKVNEDEVLTLIINVDNEIMVESDRVSGKYDKAITHHLTKLIHKNIKPIIIRASSTEIIPSSITSFSVTQPLLERAAAMAVLIISYRVEF